MDALQSLSLKCSYCEKIIKYYITIGFRNDIWDAFTGLQLGVICSFPFALWVKKRNDHKWEARSQRKLWKFLFLCEQINPNMQGKLKL